MTRATYILITGVCLTAIGCASSTESGEQVADEETSASEDELTLGGCTGTPSLPTSRFDTVAQKYISTARATESISNRDRCTFTTRLQRWSGTAWVTRHSSFPRTVTGPSGSYVQRASGTCLSGLHRSLVEIVNLTRGTSTRSGSASVQLNCTVSTSTCPSATPVLCSDGSCARVRQNYLCSSTADCCPGLTCKRGADNYLACSP